MSVSDPTAERHEPHEPARHWFEDLADHMGPAYLRYSFTMGTAQEVDFIVESLGLTPDMRILDVGCGPGRHSNELARRGFTVVGVDISQAFVDVATQRAEPGASFVRGDARAMTFDAVFDAAISLCQGAFGLGGPPVSLDPNNLTNDLGVLDGIRRALRPGGLVGLSAFSSYFQVRWLEDHDTFDAATAVNHEVTEVRDPAGTAVPADLWTTCYTPRELRLIVERAGLEVVDIWSVTPGDYRRRRPDTSTPEFLVVANRPANA